MDDALGELGEIGRAFGLGVPEGAERHGRGHIHETFVARYPESARYVHQRLNTRVFRDPERLMQNLERVTDHLQAKLARTPDAERRCLQLVRARDGKSFHVDAKGAWWRTTRYVEGTRSAARPRSTAEAEAVAGAFGSFARQLADLGAPPLAETIPHFHDLGARLAALEQAAERDAHGRRAGVGSELAAARALGQSVRRELQALGDLPRRPVHNDCKVDNLLLDARSGEGLCVVDLDTVMEGTLLCDFGELARTGACAAAEDERDLARVVFDLDRFGALARGYLAGLGQAVREAEILALHLAGPALALENAVRFLTDHLEGDVYFRIHRDGHNLDRARAQLTLTQRMTERRDDARRALDAAAAARPV